MTDHVDWKIHKKLDEARTVYYLPARGQNRSSTQEVLRLLLKGKRVIVLSNSSERPLKGSRSDYMMIDKDILTADRYERADRILRELLNSNLA